MIPWDRPAADNLRDGSAMVSYATRQMQDLLLLIGHGHLTAEEARDHARAHMTAVWDSKPGDWHPVGLLLNRYQAEGLARCLGAIMAGQTEGLNTGDWVGEIRWQIERFNALVPDPENTT